MIASKNFAILILLIFSISILPGCFIKEGQQRKKLNQILKSGNEAFVAKQYDKAIEYFDTGLAIIPDEPIFLSNKSVVLFSRGTSRYNDAIRTTDEQAKTTGFEIAKKDLIEASILSTKSVQIFKSISLPYLFDFDSQEAAKLNIFFSRAEAMRLFATIADKTKGNEALEAAHEYIALERNQEKKLKAQLATGKMLIDTGNGEKAIAEYQNILDADPNQVEALFGMGLSFAQSGQSDDFEKSKSYLLKFINHAHDGHSSITIAKEILSSMPAQKDKHIKATQH